MTTEHDWDQIQARWHSTSESATNAPDLLVLDAVGSGRALTLAAGSADHQADSSRFTLRHRFPTTIDADVRSAPYLLVVRVFAEERDRSEFRRWLDEEHCGLQVSLPGVHWFLGFEEEGDQHSFLNLWSIDRPEIVEGGDWARIRDTPWWARVSHVLDHADRGVYRRRS